MNTEKNAESHSPDALGSISEKSKSMLRFKTFWLLFFFKLR